MAAAGRKPTTSPTEPEAEILRIITAQDGQISTARQVFDAVKAYRQAAPTTINKFLSIMVTKGYVEVIRPTRPFLYRATFKPAGARLALMRQTLQRVYGGDIQRLIADAIEIRSEIVATKSKTRAPKKTPTAA